MIDRKKWYIEKNYKILRRYLKVGKSQFIFIAISIIQMETIGNFDGSTPVKSANRLFIQPSVSNYRKPGSESHTLEGSFRYPLAQNYMRAAPEGQKAVSSVGNNMDARRYTCADR